MPGYNLSSHPITNYILPSHLVTDYCLASVTSQDGRIHHFSSLHFSSTLLSLLETEHRRNPRIHRLVVFKLYFKNDRTISPYQKKKKILQFIKEIMDVLTGVGTSLPRRASPVAQLVKNPPTNAEDARGWARSLGGEDPLERKWQPTLTLLPR